MKLIHKTIKGIAIGFISCAFLVSGVASATEGEILIEIFHKQLKYKINGEMKSNLEGQGFIYKDTTYVPLRMVSEALGKEVGWDGTTNTISIDTPLNIKTSSGSTGTDSPSVTSTDTDGGSLIEVFYKQLKYKIQGKMKSDLEGKGFIYSDTTYVPLRMISESLGNEVGWNGTTNTISIGVTSTSPSTTAGVK